jgi:hypothetical protein
MQTLLAAKKIGLKNATNTQMTALEHSVTLSQSIILLREEQKQLELSGAEKEKLLNLKKELNGMKKLTKCAKLHRNYIFISTQ